MIFSQSEASFLQMVNTPMVPNTFLLLKYLCITLSAVTLSPSYDYLSLVSFLDACPSLDTFIVDVSHTFTL